MEHFNIFPFDNHFQMALNQRKDSSEVCCWARLKVAKWAMKKVLTYTCVWLKDVQSLDGVAKKTRQGMIHYILILWTVFPSKSHLF